MFGGLDRFEGGVKRLTVFEKLDARSVAERYRIGFDPAVVFASGQDIQTQGCARFFVLRDEMRRKRRLASGVMDWHRELHFSKAYCAV